jgi:hypothetical protein
MEEGSASQTYRRLADPREVPARLIGASLLASSVPRGVTGAEGLAVLEACPVGSRQSPVSSHRRAASSSARYNASLKPMHCNAMHATLRAPAAYNCPVS